MASAPFARFALELTLSKLIIQINMIDLDYTILNFGIIKMDKWSEIRAFVAVVEQQSFAAAANTLNLAPSRRQGQPSCHEPGDAFGRAVAEPDHAPG